MDSRNRPPTRAERRARRQQTKEQSFQLKSRVFDVEYITPPDENGDQITISNVRKDEKNCGDSMQENHAFSPLIRSRYAPKQVQPHSTEPRVFDVEYIAPPAEQCCDSKSISSNAKKGPQENAFRKPAAVPKKQKDARPKKRAVSRATPMRKSSRRSIPTNFYHNSIGDDVAVIQAKAISEREAAESRISAEEASVSLETPNSSQVTDSVSQDEPGSTSAEYSTRLEGDGDSVAVSVTTASPVMESARLPVTNETLVADEDTCHGAQKEASNDANPLVENTTVSTALKQNNNRPTPVRKSSRGDDLAVIQAKAISEREAELSTISQPSLESNVPRETAAATDDGSQISFTESQDALDSASAEKTITTKAVRDDRTASVTTRTLVTKSARSLGTAKVPVADNKDSERAASTSPEAPASNDADAAEEDNASSARRSRRRSVPTDFYIAGLEDLVKRSDKLSKELEDKPSSTKKAPVEKAKRGQSKRSGSSKARKRAAPSDDTTPVLECAEEMPQLPQHLAGMEVSETSPDEADWMSFLPESEPFTGREESSVPRVEELPQALESRMAALPEASPGGVGTTPPKRNKRKKQPLATCCLISGSPKDRKKDGVGNRKAREKPPQKRLVTNGDGMIASLLVADVSDESHTTKRSQTPEACSKPTGGRNERSTDTTESVSALSSTETKMCRQSHSRKDSLAEPVVEEPLLPKQPLAKSKRRRHDRPEANRRGRRPKSWHPVKSRPAGTERGRSRPRKNSLSTSSVGETSSKSKKRRLGSIKEDSLLGLVVVEKPDTFESPDTLARIQSERPRGLPRTVSALDVSISQSSRKKTTSKKVVEPKKHQKQRGRWRKLHLPRGASIGTPSDTPSLSPKQAEQDSSSFPEVDDEVDETPTKRRKRLSMEKDVITLAKVADFSESSLSDPDTTVGASVKQSRPPKQSSTDTAFVGNEDSTKRAWRKVRPATDNGSEAHSSGANKKRAASGIVKESVASISTGMGDAAGDAASSAEMNHVQGKDKMFFEDESIDNVGRSASVPAFTIQTQPSAPAIVQKNVAELARTVLLQERMQYLQNDDDESQDSEDDLVPPPPPDF